MSESEQLQRRKEAFRALRARDDRIPFTSLVESPIRKRPQTRSSLSEALAARNARRALFRGLQRNPCVSEDKMEASANASPKGSPVTTAARVARDKGVLLEPLAMGLVRDRTHVLNLRFVKRRLRVVCGCCCDESSPFCAA